MVTVKSDISRATAGEIRDKLILVSGKLSGNGTFPTPPMTPANLTGQATAISGKLADIAAHDLAGQELTIQLRELREAGADMISQDATYVQTTVNQMSGSDETRAAAVVGAGYGVVEAAGPVGPMPQVENLRVTQGDDDGSLDAAWDPVVRGLQTFVIQTTTDPAGMTGWQAGGLTKKSSFTITGLTSGQRYRIRVAAMGAAGQGPWSDVATKVAP